MWRFPVLTVVCCGFAFFLLVVGFRRCVSVVVFPSRTGFFPSQAPPSGAASPPLTCKDLTWFVPVFFAAYYRDLVWLFAACSGFNLVFLVGLVVSMRRCIAGAALPSHNGSFLSQTPLSMAVSTF
jgi:hypothetical protein